MPSLAIRYGAGRMWIDVPSRKILGIPTYRPIAPPPRNPLPVLEQALEITADGPPFAEWVRPGARTCVVVPDRSVYAAAEHCVPLLLDRLAKAGVPADRIEILVACGVRPPAPDDTLDALLGKGVRARVRVTQSDARDAAAFVDAGRSPRGLPVRLHRTLAGADQIVLTGLASLHPWLGFTGGTAMIAAGCADAETLRDLHLLQFAPEGPLARAPGVASGAREGNPVYVAARDAAALLPKPVFLFNTIVTPDDRLLDVASGAPEPAFDAACHILNDQFAPPCEGKAKLVVAGAGGYPRDMDFLQALLAIEHAAPLLEDGGLLVMHAECREGWGFARPGERVDASDPAGLARCLAKDAFRSAVPAILTRSYVQRFQIVLVSSLPAGEVQAAGMEAAATPEDAVKLYGTRLAEDPPAYILPEAGLVAPRPAADR